MTEPFMHYRFSTLLKEEPDAVRKVHFAHNATNPADPHIHIHYQLWLRGALSPTTVRQLIWNGDRGLDLYPDDIRVLYPNNARDMWDKLQQEGFKVLHLNADRPPEGVKFVELSVLERLPQAKIQSGFEPTHFGFSGRGGSLRSPLKPT